MNCALIIHENWVTKKWCFIDVPFLTHELCFLIMRIGEQEKLRPVHSTLHSTTWEIGLGLLDGQFFEWLGQL
jgi:hypothetical protein